MGTYWRVGIDFFMVKAHLEWGRIRQKELNDKIREFFPFNYECEYVARCNLDNLFRQSDFDKCKRKREADLVLLQGSCGHKNSWNSKVHFQGPGLKVMDLGNYGQGHGRVKEFHFFIQVFHDV